MDPLSVAPFSIAYVDATRARELMQDDRMMAAIGFGARSRLDPKNARCFTVGLPSIDESDTVEIWRSGLPVRDDRRDGVRLVANDEVLFGHMLVDEADYPDFEGAVYETYRRIHSVTAEQGYPHMLRVWNYIPDINLESGALERYKSFCVGRYRALEKVSDFEGKLPAACAIGTHSPGLLIYFLAATRPAIQVENPRQVSAFRYPKQYGPRSPSFSRAALKTWGDESHLYISGTASIVGHDTRHRRDTSSQFDETLRNLEALIASGNRYLASIDSSSLRPALFKVYARGEADVAALRERIEQRLGTDVPTVFLRGDICRSNLLIEIDGVCVGGKGEP